MLFRLHVAALWKLAPGWDESHDVNHHGNEVERYFILDLHKNDATREHGNTGHYKGVDFATVHFWRLNKNFKNSKSKPQKFMTFKLRINVICIKNINGHCKMKWCVYCMPTRIHFNILSDSWVFMMLFSFHRMASKQLITYCTCTSKSFNKHIL